MNTESISLRGHLFPEALPGVSIYTVGYILLRAEIIPRAEGRPELISREGSALELALLVLMFRSHYM